MSRNIKLSVDEFYHIYNRRNDKNLLFFDNHDKDRFVRLLYLCNKEKPVVFKTVQGLTLDEISKNENGETLVDIGAYCLMPTHFHVLLKEKVENGISLFMGKLSTGYSMYFNKNHSRSGGLFEGTFRARHVDEDRYLKYLFAYIHLNPVKIIDPSWKEKGISSIERAKKFLEEYRHSSYFDYVGRDREEKLILNKAAFPEYFTDVKSFEIFVNDWLNFRE